MVDTPVKPEKYVDRDLIDYFPASDPPANSGTWTIEERKRRDEAESASDPE